MLERIGELTSWAGTCAGTREYVNGAPALVGVPCVSRPRRTHRTHATFGRFWHNEAVTPDPPVASSMWVRLRRSCTATADGQPSFSARRRALSIPETITSSSSGSSHCHASARARSIITT